MIKQISNQLNIPYFKVNNTVQLLKNGASIPFIARYRKEATGNLDEEQIEFIQNLVDEINTFEKRKTYILGKIKEQGQLSQELAKQIEQCTDSNELEDIYLPYKSKKKTKASIAKEKGLLPLAEIILLQKEKQLKTIVRQFINNEVKTSHESLEGARHIIAEIINEHIPTRNALRLIGKEKVFFQCAVKKKKESEATTFKDYFDYSEVLHKIPGHRLLAMLRGEDEGFLRIKIELDKNEALKIIKKQFLKAYNDCSYQISLAAEDAFGRLLMPSLATEFKNNAKEKADKEAIEVFAKNLRQLLLEAPLGEKSIMGIDPGFRTGCKVAIIDKKGQFVTHTSIFPHQPQLQQVASKETIIQLLKQHKIDAIAIGNGTASRETEYFIKDCISGMSIEVFIVNEAGASIYSASAVAREEFPNLDITVRGAISIARRLQDPLAELVKIDAKSIGVGQYQHDVNQNLLKRSLENTVISVVNHVGIQLNTASYHVLKYVSGIGPQLAKNIVSYRKSNGSFSNRKTLKKVSGLGDKAFEQCAGFLRIPNSKNLLDNTAVHPERYALVERMAKDMGMDLSCLIQSPKKIQQIQLSKYIDESTNLASLQDIIATIQKPGLDPRGQAAAFHFAPIQSIDDLQEGMVVPGIINNITKFGAFVNIGIKENGLIHISQAANRFVDDLQEVFSIHQKVQAKVIGIDKERKRIQLSTKEG